MSKKVQVFNLIAGITIVGTMVYLIISGANNLPYVIIALFFVSYWLQKVNIMKFTKVLGIIITSLLLL
ncbi:hypothetical protein CUU66_01385 [Peribacillus deserti]|uniref:Uncharacterized protein n=1 Tax=Peribacillus deserti TaxID=673318 RepID=A0A2N5MBU3_9BACI|nr:hypothetical protein CUU66_01385 [Peribacillus deserti]